MRGNPPAAGARNAKARRRWCTEALNAETLGRGTLKSPLDSAEALQNGVRPTGVVIHLGARRRRGAQRCLGTGATGRIASSVPASRADSLHPDGRRHTAIGANSVVPFVVPPDWRTFASRRCCCPDGRRSAAVPRFTAVSSALRVQRSSVPRLGVQRLKGFSAAGGLNAYSANNGIKSGSVFAASGVERTSGLWAEARSLSCRASREMLGSRGIPALWGRGCEPGARCSGAEANVFG